MTPSFCVFFSFPHMLGSLVHSFLPLLLCCCSVSSTDAHIHPSNLFSEVQLCVKENKHPRPQDVRWRISSFQSQFFERRVELCTLLLLAWCVGAIIRPLFIIHLAICSADRAFHFKCLVVASQPSDYLLIAFVV